MSIYPKRLTLNNHRFVPGSIGTLVGSRRILKTINRCSQLKGQMSCCDAEKKILDYKDLTNRIHIHVVNVVKNTYI
jgi:hypothetical protein